jgi:anti-sigma B factor antagonist
MTPAAFPAPLIRTSGPSPEQDSRLGDAFEVIVEYADGGAVVSVRGEVDVLTAPILRAALTEADGGADGGIAPASLTVDMADMTFIDASGLGVLVGAAGRARRRGQDLVLRDPSRSTLRVLAITRLLDVFRID